MLGLSRLTVSLEDYDKRWKKLYVEESKKIKDALGKILLETHHVGSTSIVGMKAKPILDILLVFHSEKERQDSISILAKLGYVYIFDAGTNERFFFRKSDSRKYSTHHLHAVLPESKDYYELLLFRDYLRKNKEAANEYLKLKTHLAEKHKNEREKYTSSKENFIKEIVLKAAAEKGAQIYSLFKPNNTAI